MMGNPFQFPPDISRVEFLYVLERIEPQAAQNWDVILCNIDAGIYSPIYQQLFMLTQAFNFRLVQVRQYKQMRIK